MSLTNKYAIALSFPQTFQELLYRLTKWRQTRQSLYNITYSIKPYQLIAINTSTTEQDIETFQNIIYSTLSTLDTVGEFFEKHSFYNSAYFSETPSASELQTISTETPLSTVASENLVFDIDNLYKSVIQILKTYGQFNKEEGLWIMNSREDTFRAYDLILNNYPIFPQLISYFPYPDPNLPAINQDMSNLISNITPDTNNTVQEPSENSNTNNPVLKIIYDQGLNILLSTKSNIFNVNLADLNDGTIVNNTKLSKFQIIYFDNNSEQTIIVDNATNNSQSNVIDENTYIYPSI